MRLGGPVKTLSIPRRQWLDWRKLMWSSETVALVERIWGLRNFQRCVDGRKRYLKMWKIFETHVKGYWALYQNVRSPATELCAYVQVWTISLCVQRTQTLQSFLSIWRYCRTGRWESYAVTYLPLPANMSFNICNQIPFATRILLLIH